MHRLDQGTTTNQLLARRVSEAMQQVGFRQLAVLICKDEGSTVTLTGTTETYYLKQVAQTIAAKVAGVERIINDIVVSEYKSDPRGPDI